MSDIVELSQVPFATKYFVSSDGRVFRQLAASDDGKGYARVDLPHDGKAHYYVRVNRLIAGAFLPPPQIGETIVRHLDGNSRNNSANNLAWGTAQDNANDRDIHGTTARGESHGCAKLTSDQVREIRILSASGWSQRALGRRYDVDKSTISRIIKWKSWTAETDRLQRQEGQR